MSSTVELNPLLRRLRLSGVLETLEVRNKQAIEERMSYVDFMSLVLNDEHERREQKKLSMRIRRGSFDVTKTFETFNWEFNAQINRKEWFDLATCNFMGPGKKENVLVVGPTGVGKSHLSQALGSEACRRGYDVMFVTAAKLLARLNAGRADGTLEKRIAAMAKADLLIIDDFGLTQTPIRPPGSEDFYQVVAERYERASTVITSNRDFDEWPGLFNEPLLAGAALDRLRHHAHRITIKGPSYRGNTEATKERKVSTREGGKKAIREEEK